MTNRIYLDHNATAPLEPAVLAAMDECYQRYPGNPSSQHQSGRAARRRLDETREHLAQLFGANLGGRRPDRILFTSGGTESNNLALRGLGRRAGGARLVSAIEHPSVARLAAALSAEGESVSSIPVDATGVVQLDALAALVQQPTRVVSILWANHETGVCQPIGAAAQICQAAGVPLHSDAAQAVGRVPVDFSSSGASALSVAAHKFGGPRGVGALVLRHDVELQPLLWGGTQQSDLRPGTEPLALVVGMEIALAERLARRADWSVEALHLRDAFEARIVAGWPGTVVHGEGAARLPQTSCLSLVGLDRQALLLALDQEGIECSTGSACASGASETSPTLRAMGCANDQLTSALRFSFGPSTSAAAIAEAADRILLVCNRLREAEKSRKFAVTPR